MREGRRRYLQRTVRVGMCPRTLVAPIVVLSLLALPHRSEAQHVIGITPVKNRSGAAPVVLNAAAPTSCSQDSDCTTDSKCTPAKTCAKKCISSNISSICQQGEWCDTGGFCRPETASDRYTPNLENLVLSGDVAFNSQDVQSKTYVTPAFNGDYKGFAFGADPKATFTGIYDFHIAIQAPATSPVNASDAIQRVLLLGGDGYLAGGFRVADISADSKRGVLLGVDGSVAWSTVQLNPGGTAPATSDTFAFISADAMAAAWIGPAY